MVHIGILGAGCHSRGSHGPALQLLRQHDSDLTLAAVCDVDAARAESYARDFGVERAYTDLEAMLRAERLDGLIAVTPVEQTAAVAKRVLSAGIPMLIEKPPGATVAEATALAELLRRIGTPHMVSFNRRFNPAVLRAKEWLSIHAATRPVRLIIARMLRHRREEPNFVLHTGVHLLDTIISFVTTLELLNVTAVKSMDPAPGMYEARLSFADDLEATVCIAPRVGLMEESYEVLGEDYGMRIDVGEVALEVFDGGREVLDWKPDRPLIEAERNGTLGETEAFLQSLRGRRDWRPTVEDALWSLRAAEAIQDEVPATISR